MFEIAKNGDTVQLTMSREELALAVELSQYFLENFETEDFFTIGDASKQELQGLLGILEQNEAELKDGVEQTSLILTNKNYHIFKSVFTLARRSFDDKPDFEDRYEDIEVIADVMSPPIIQ